MFRFRFKLMFRFRFTFMFGLFFAGLPHGFTLSLFRVWFRLGLGLI